MAEQGIVKHASLMNLTERGVSLSSIVAIHDASVAAAAAVAMVASQSIHHRRPR